MFTHQYSLKEKEHVQTDSVFITHIRTKWAKKYIFLFFLFSNEEERCKLLVTTYNRSIIANKMQRTKKKPEEEQSTVRVIEKPVWCST